MTRLDDGLHGDEDGGVLDEEVNVDDEEFNARRRIKAINDARDRVRRSYVMSEARQIEGAMTDLERRQAVRATARVYYSEVRPIIRHELESSDGSDQTGDAARLLDADGLGTISLERPAGLQDVHGVSTNISGEYASRQGTEIAISGVRALVKLPSPVVVRWRHREQRPVTGGEMSEVVTQTDMPAEMALYAAELIDEFLAEHGFGVIDDGPEEAGFDYEDLLPEPAQNGESP